MAETVERKPRLIRKSALVVCVVAAALLVVAHLVVAGSALAGRAETQLTTAAGAEVNIASLDVSLLGGKLVLGGLQVTDPEKPTHNMIAVEEIVGDLSLTGLAAKTLVIETLRLKGFSLDVPRESPGRVEPRADEAEPAERELLCALLRSSSGKLLAI